jgi:outer membrane lipoprotein-sorting protein
MTRPSLLAALLALCALLAGRTYADSAEDIVQQTDQVRNPEQAFRTTVTLTEYASGHERNQNTLAVFAKPDSATRQFRNLVEYLAPARDAGKRVLLNGPLLWFYDPASKQSVRISPQQRIVGQAAVGDILTVNLKVDYSSTLLGMESVDDAARQPRHCWHLRLKAAAEQATYNQIELWVEEETYYPIKGKFYSDSGRLLKVAYYRNFRENLGRMRPTELVILDAVDSSLATIATFGDYQYRDIPELWFQREYLPHLETQ